MHVVALAAGPAHALYFSCYERMKILLSGTSQAGHNPLANGFAGCFATLLHDALMVPADGMSIDFHGKSPTHLLFDLQRSNNAFEFMHHRTPVQWIVSIKLFVEKAFRSSIEVIQLN